MLRFNISARRADWRLEAQATLDSGCAGLFGRSGSGKSTLLGLLAGLLEPEEGTITLDDRTLFDRGSRIDEPAHRRQIGVVFQDHRLFPQFSVEGNLRYGIRDQGKTSDAFGFDRIVSLLELEPLLARGVNRLSGGEKRRVALGRTLLAAPRVLLLDEPLTGLDASLKSGIIALLQRVRDDLGIPMVYVSHDLTEILQLTSQLWVLERGKLLGQGTYRDLVQDPSVISHMLPLGLTNVIPTTVQRHEANAGCTLFEVEPSLATTDGPTPPTLQGPLLDAPLAHPIALSLRPEDVALSPRPVDLISVRNQIRGTVRRHSETDGLCIVEIDAGFPLLVEISAGSLSRLGLEPGTEIWCLIKATALRPLGWNQRGVD